MPKLARTDRAAAILHDARVVSTMARVWDPLVRAFHWSLVLSFAVAWFSSHRSADIHQWAGFAAGGLILMRLLWGIMGTRYARFSQFVRHPVTILRYLGAILKGTEARYVGHNPAGGAMVVTLMIGMLITATTGYMMTTDAYYGVDWVEAAHSLAAHGMLALVLVHLAGVVLASVRHEENLVVAMVSGRKRKARPGDID